MENKWMKKGFAVSVIILFIGIAVAPSINSIVVKASNDNDFVEVSSQACGIQGYGDTSVKLTREQYQDLEQYLVDFRARLNQTTTKEEAIPIFKDAVLELNKYGLLPKGMSVKQAQRLVTGQCVNQKRLDVIQNVLKRNHGGLSRNENWCCLFYGYLTFVQVLGILWRILYMLPDPQVPYPIGLWIFWMICEFIYYLKPFYVLCPVQFEETSPEPKEHVFTIGLLGIKKWDGQLVGDINLPFYGECGVQGFTGINIVGQFTSIPTVTLIGTAFYVAMHEYVQS